MRPDSAKHAPWDLSNIPAEPDQLFGSIAENMISAGLGPLSCREDSRAEGLPP